ncbi:MAG: hypothetical protein B7O98_02315 [Zestosphaera tikiterensis]|uniref:Uncharacterized protein n=1 Tax=Zestosphaera tikiterensis TaxID=1973259 RepID=A0A2R7Y727_9CREN|nr:MAG: hypothetical protein B7O98_02315 [Zestosphaera tikiterensis]
MRVFKVKGISELTIDLLFMMLMLSISSVVFYSLTYIYGKELQEDTPEYFRISTEVRVVKLIGKEFKLAVIWSTDDKLHTVEIICGGVTRVVQLRPYDVVIERIGDDITLFFADGTLVPIEEVFL